MDWKGGGNKMDFQKMRGRGKNKGKRGGDSEP
jgi:hypothetical protein